MKTIYFIIAISFLSLQTLAADCNKMTDIRNKFHAARCGTEVQQFLKFAKKIECSKAYPYYASAFMKQAEYVSSPMKKLNYFKRGKAMLEAYIKKHPNDIEARYVRVLVQKNVPSILGYSDKINSDTKFIRSQIAKSELSTSYKKTILKYIKS